MRPSTAIARCAVSGLVLAGILAWHSFAAAQAPTGPAPAAQVRVRIHNYAFHPATLRIAPGTTVTWVNQDDDVHTVMNADHGHPFSSKPLNTGQSFSHTFDAPGIYPYLCSVHPFMTGAIIVKAGA